jgi:hypothetical protein
MYLPQLHGGRKVPRADRVAPQRAETASAASRCQNHETDLLWRNNLPGVCVNIFAHAVPAFAEPETTVWVDQNENSPSYECSARRRIAFSAGYPHLNYGGLSASELSVLQEKWPRLRNGAKSGRKSTFVDALQRTKLRNVPPPSTELRKSAFEQTDCRKLPAAASRRVSRLLFHYRAFRSY